MSPHRSIRRQRSGRQSDVLTTDEISTRVLAQEARESAELIAAQNRVLELVARGTPLHHTLDVLLQEIEAQTPGTLCSILLVDPDGVHVRHGAAPSLPESYIQAIDGEPIGPRAGSCGTAAHHGEPVIVEDIATDPLWESYRTVALAYNLRACWSTPIFDGEHRVLGTFALYFRTPGRPTPRHYRVINATTYTAGDRDRHPSRERGSQTPRCPVQGGRTHRAARKLRLGRSLEHGASVRRAVPHLRSTARDVPSHVRSVSGARASGGPCRDARDHRDVGAQRTPFEFDERIVRPDGVVRYLHSLGRWVVNDAGERLKLVGVCQDITDRKHAEEQLRTSETLRVRNEELKSFAYMVSHDLKAPLRGIAGYGRELEREHRGRLGDRGAHCVDAIVAATQNLDRLIEDLLDYSRLDAETATATDVDLIDVVNAIVEDCRAAIAAHGTQISLDLPVTHLRTWKRGLTQILTNLMDNAIKFSRDSRPPRIRVASEAHPDAVHLVVADNGIGFDMDHRERIFGLFNRLVSADQFDGTGAGLAIVKKIAERVGARVHAESSLGGGATFVVELPHAGVRARA
jgi:signal transduction histidine kinase